MSGRILSRKESLRTWSTRKLNGGQAWWGLLVTIWQNVKLQSHGRAGKMTTQYCILTPCNYPVKPNPKCLYRKEINLRDWMKIWEKMESTSPPFQKQGSSTVAVSVKNLWFLLDFFWYMFNKTSMFCLNHLAHPSHMVEPHQCLLSKAYNGIFG